MPPVPATELYDDNVEAFAAATALSELPPEFRDLLDAFVDRVDDGPDRPRVLDAGCGPGRDAAYFHGRGLEPVGVDAAAGMVAYARANRPGRYLRMDLRRLGFPADTFAGLWCPASVFFLDPPGVRTALAEFARVLAPGGHARVGFKLGDGRHEVEKWGATTVEYRVDRSEARALLDEAGFVVGEPAVNEVSPESTFANVPVDLPAGRRRQ